MARLVVIAPGRGSYNRTELNYMTRFSDHPRYAKRGELLAEADRLRARSGRTTVTELDSATGYRPGIHLPGENASALIYTASAADYQMISPQHKVEAVLGNSMGWYTSLYLSGALTFKEAFRVVDTMGCQQESTEGGQLIYPLVDEQWHHEPERAAEAEAAVAAVASQGAQHWVGLSIRLGGFVLYAGSEAGIKALLKQLPPVTIGSNNYPYQLPRHLAFHTHLMQAAADYGQAQLGNIAWQQPQRPMIDGRGYIWRWNQTQPAELSQYSFSHQVLKPYDFTASVRVAIREYNPDHLVLLGPGETLGGSIAQVIISEGWRGVRSRQDFVDAQKEAQPPLLAMNRPAQAAQVI